MNKDLNDDVTVLLQQHSEWLDSQGETGSRAQFANLDLKRQDFSNADLRHADFGTCQIENTNFHNTALNFADLSNTRGLLVQQLAGTDLSGALLPADVVISERLEHISALINAARKVFFIMLIAVAYSWLTLATTSDIDLHTNASTSPLPIILTELPVAGFYWVAPLILLGFYIYLHLHLQRLWEDLALLPAFFPDGRSLEEHVQPWLLTGLIQAYNPHLRMNRPTLSHLQNAIAIILAWYIVPFTIVALWLRYLPRHDIWPSSFHVLCIVIISIAGIVFYRLAKQTLALHSKIPHRRGRFLGHFLFTVALLAGFLLLPLFTFGVQISSSNRDTKLSTIDPRFWATPILQSLGFNPHPDFTDREVSRRPADLMAMAELEAVRGANLKAADLHHLAGSGAFLALADLQGAILQDANLELADLRRANLQESILRRAKLLQSDLRNSNLSDSDLREAELIKANLQGANLTRADLRGAFLNHADLRNSLLQRTDLREAQLENADLRGATLHLPRLHNTNFKGADLRQVKGLSCTQLERSRVNKATRLPSQLNCPGLPRN